MGIGQFIVGLHIRRIFKSQNGHALATAEGKWRGAEERKREWERDTGAWPDCSLYPQVISAYFLLKGAKSLSFNGSVPMTLASRVCLRDCMATDGSGVQFSNLLEWLFYIHEYMDV